jgi:hypothetical protein
VAEEGGEDVPCVDVADPPPSRPGGQPGEVAEEGGEDVPGSTSDRAPPAAQPARRSATWEVAEEGGEDVPCVDV